MTNIISIGYTKYEVFLEEFSDHAGQPATRFGAREPEDDSLSSDDDSWDSCLYVDNSWPPKYESDPQFCFQVYITFDLELDERTCNTIMLHLMDAYEQQQFKPPVWDFYVAPRTILECVDHSRREIAHRRACNTLPLINPFCHDHVDVRKLGFAFILDNESGWRKPITDTQFSLEHFPDNTGPLWAHFDPRIPSSVTKVDNKWRFHDDREENILDQLEMEVKRIVGADTHHDILSMYSHSSREDLDFIDEDKDDGKNAALAETESLPAHLDLLQLASGFTVTRSESVISIANSSGEPDLRYVVCMTFAGDIEQTARVFAASVAQLTDKSFCFVFYAATSDTAALASCPAASVGVLTEAFARCAIWAVNTERPAPGLRRLHPINYDPPMFYQDPATSLNPFTTCLVVLDRPDFTRVPAVRFLLAGGRSQRGPHENSRIYAAPNYLQMQSWRCSSMQAVVDRLTLDFTPIAGRRDSCQSSLDDPVF